MLQVKKYANYFHLLTNTTSILYALTYNCFYYNYNNLTYFNTYFHEMAQKKGADFTANTLKTLKYYEKTTYFFNRKLPRSINVKTNREIAFKTPTFRRAHKLFDCST